MRDCKDYMDKYKGKRGESRRKICQKDDDTLRGRRNGEILVREKVLKIAGLERDSERKYCSLRA